ncbi:MAG: hypothetical protein FJW39_07870 [Acidobacteria bacterium]|nr:hypothetical protein [Acidobacteriota bacterium]
MKPWMVFLAAAAVTSTGFIKVCDWVFQCGCDWLWAAADAHCNIHNKTGKHCPFCSFGYSGYAAIFSTIVAVQAAASFLFAWSWRVRLAAALLAFPATFIVLALALGKYTGYWD